MEDDLLILYYVILVGGDLIGGVYGRIIVELRDIIWYDGILLKLGWRFKNKKEGIIIIRVKNLRMFKFY